MRRAMLPQTSPSLPHPRFSPTVHYKTSLDNSSNQLSLPSHPTPLVPCTSLSAAMAAATTMHSTALAGQSLLKPVNDLARQVGSSEARIAMRNTVSKSSGSDGVWYGAAIAATASSLGTTDGTPRDCPPTPETVARNRELEVIHSRWAKSLRNMATASIQGVVQLAFTLHL